MNKRILYTILAGIVALSMILGGVWAWADSSQHKSNVVTGGNQNEKQDAILVEDFEEPDDWQEGDDLKKEVWVKNTGEGRIFVRLQLKEYMEIAKQTYEYSNDYLLVDSDGRFVTATSAANLKVWLAANMPGLVYNDSQIKSFTAYGDTAKFYFVTDETTNLNGKYGKLLLTDYNQTAARPLIENAVRGDYDPVPGHSNLECAYTPHLWDKDDIANCEQGDDSEDYDGTGLGFHDYVEWLLGAQVITLTDWIAAGAEPVAKWILDDSSAAGWAYWGEALRPGEGTEKLLEEITLVKQPNGPFYYVIHVDMQACDLYQLTATFTGMPEEIEDSFRGKTGFYLSADKQVFVKNNAGDDGRITFKAYWNDSVIPAANVTWSVDAMDGQAKNAYTRFATADTVAGTPTPGVLTIGGGQAPGRLLVTAVYTPSGGTARTQQFIITVK
ncbi:MAG: hypothetical protein FWH26_10825 [Oscillospiraceae bacterium]|nr:hypothetical protein [Oscillospiraceae bacterium]